LIEDEIKVTVDMGGKIADVLERTEHAELNCWLGFNACRRRLDMSEWYAYPHQGGIPDGRGRMWWLYLRCECGYDYSWWKILRRMESRAVRGK
jgi:hypothetical protein